MKTEALKNTLKLKFQSGKIDISDISIEKLKELGIADKQKNRIDTKRLRLGSLGAYINFDNESDDELIISSSSLEITSNSITRIEEIINGLKKLYGQTEFFSGELVTNRHLIDDKLPERVLHDYSTEKSYTTDLIQLRKGLNTIHLYECGKDILHLKLSIQLKNKISLDQLLLEETFGLKSETELLDELIKNKITHE